MSVGQYVWIGVDHGKKVWEDGYADSHTVAPTESICRRRIADLNTSAHLVPELKMLILKGRIREL